MSLAAAPRVQDSAEDDAVAAAVARLAHDLGAVVAVLAPRVDDASLSDLVRTLEGVCRCEHDLRRLIAACLLRAERVASSQVEGVAGAGWAEVGATSLSQLAEERLSLSATEAWQLVRAARAAQTSAALALRVESRDLALAKAASIERVLVAVRENGDEQRLLDFACANTTHATRREVARIEEELRTAERTSSVTLHLTRRALADLQRSRELLADGRGGPLPSASNAVTTALAEFVERHCPERGAGRARRRGAGGANEGDADTANEGGPSRTDRAQRAEAKRSGRAVPSHVRHELTELCGDVCWVAGCDERGALQTAHRQAFRHGGGQDARNLARWCLHHHRLIDSGELQLRAGRDGGVLVSRAGVPVARTRPGVPP